MTSKTVLILHSIVFGSFVLFSLSSPIFAVWYSEFFSSYFFPAAIVLTPVVFGLWYMFRGCPFTVWENYFRKRERKLLIAKNSCIYHYALEWFNVRIPLRLIQPVLVLLFIIPIFVGLVV
ncbi:MAG: hypothetical protein COU47_03240 [Candidatus Niyogibacteria bacterium CG10_big_fil_rev_8_21_14_0_10_46_36]|uniref:DUF2784 domain-containing protein n=1 Tax=Candidatus Niyogibacteria bacterium CG10_big_fil_rev_8_21_14_0_10_46_36 TaxID=1974726 RepID=A0A2H0TCR7_9BACT|nr:MAG: hypothetical protein COU47_03240 [Candidatus Niyogibacteria bacterium CG10_big_fil_rev_8_21_14_0_10_46_36]